VERDQHRITLFFTVGIALESPRRGSKLVVFQSNPIFSSRVLETSLVIHIYTHSSQFSKLSKAYATEMNI